jgi:hypothetical protein
MDLENKNFDYAWEDIKDVFGLEGRSLSPSPHLQKSNLEFLKSEQLCQGILDYLQAEVELRLRASVVPAFWEYFSQSSLQNSNEVEKAQIFQKV